MIKECKQRSVTEHGVFDNFSWLLDEISISHQISKFNRPSDTITSKADDVVRLHFGLRGNYSFTYHQLGKQFNLIGGHHNIMFSKGFDIEVSNKTLELETFGIQFSKQSFIAFTQDSNDALKKFCESIIEGNNAILSNQWGPLTPEIECAIRQITNCRYTGRMKQILIFSKCLELLVLSVEGCINANQRQALYIKNDADKERLIAARDLINERLHSPPTFSEVALSVGLNEFKLKRGFKEMFDTTVFGYLAEQRLSLAHQYLRDNQKTAAQIAYSLGYATPQHFNNAFKKRFGITPFSLKKAANGQL